MSFDCKKRVSRYSSRLAACALAVLCWSASAFAAQQVIINGSTTVLPVVQKAGEAFMASHPGTELSISGGGSGNGIKALIEKQCDVAMSSRDIKDKEKDAAAKNGITPLRTAIAIDAIVPVVHPANKVGALTLAQLRDIYTGKVTNWKDLGGEDAQIVAISRDTSSGTFESWEELVMNKERVSPRALMQASNGSVVQTVSKNKNAIGYVGLGYVDKSTRPVTVDGVSPSAETAISKQWPIARELYIFTNGAPQGAVKEFVEYLVAPDKGQKDVLAVGYVPLSK
ncbi:MULTISPECIES: phosphate ABC transporter substrate-binding protein [Desulfovibrio]|uniref:Phosphate-binding protein n=3 Tax=Desulfovibrio TaxID=872 RepID=A0AA94HS82_DESDE|nr:MULTISPECIES: phosphate ABC transporter substrate-binding protein [Desulfovibrio]ATD81929.1 phosphate ABC transporter substrate-binding protein [Desulfovibrio sp. G11]SFW41025.1 phosphate transport system substrate-binding protein [Desulfovibrio desulfuricans]SPD34675.1 ABC transporter, phosphate transporting, phosphate binding protein [Desulfovibrio sp. G11]